MFEKQPTFVATEKDIRYYAKVYTYPDGAQDIVAASVPVFKAEGWEERQRPQAAKPKKEPPKEGTEEAARRAADSQQRSMRRARARVRRLALSNDFRWFVTLTLDQTKVDRYDMGQIVRRLNVWCSNMVQRQGLQYILVPERHKDGAIHFHGFFNDCVSAVDSGHKDKEGHTVYNLPQWDLGFTTAIELYGEYRKAVAYVCKYIGKQGEKPAGRWYYSGGGLREPKTDLADISAGELLDEYGDRAWALELPGRLIAGVNGVNDE